MNIDEAKKFIQFHGKSGNIPAPIWDAAPVQVFVIIEDDNPVAPFIMIAMTKDYMDSVALALRSFRDDGNMDYTNLFVATRTKAEPSWKLQNLSHIHFYV